MQQRVSKVEAARRQAQEAAYARAKKYKTVFGSPEGREVLDDILNRICGARQSIMSTNPMAVYIQATRRDIADAIVRTMDGLPDEVNEGQDG